MQKTCLRDEESAGKSTAETDLGSYHELHNHSSRVSCSICLNLYKDHSIFKCTSLRKNQENNQNANNQTEMLKLNVFFWMPNVKMSSLFSRPA